MNKKFLAIAGALTVFIFAVLVGTFSVASNQRDIVSGMSTSPVSEKILNGLGIKTQDQLNAQTQDSLMALEFSDASQMFAVADQAKDTTPTLPITQVTTSSHSSFTHTDSKSETVNDKMDFPASFISEQQAREIAQRAAPNTSVTATPELVRYAGQMAYEVVMGTGQVYVDARTGMVLDNSAVGAPTHAYEHEDDDDDEGHEYKDKRKKNRREKEEDNDDHERHRG